MILQRGGLRQRMLAMKTKALLAILLALASCGEENRTQKQVDVGCGELLPLSRGLHFRPQQRLLIRNGIH